MQSEIIIATSTPIDWIMKTADKYGIDVKINHGEKGNVVYSYSPFTHGILY